MKSIVLGPKGQTANQGGSVNHFLLIDMLRAFAAMAIVVYHARVDLWVGFKLIASHRAEYSHFDRVVSFLSAPVSVFRSGVMLFFLISGFCIHYPYVDGKRDLTLPSYWARRWLRIYPPYLLAVLITILIEQIRYHAALVTPSAHSKIWATVFMIQNYMRDPAQMVGNSALWSLPVEMELYLLYPIFWLLIRRLGVRYAFVIVSFVSATTVLVILTCSPLRQRYAAIGQVGNAFMYWAVWCGGAMLAERVQDPNFLLKRRPRVGQILFAFAVSITAVLSTLRDWPIEFQELLWAAFWYLAMSVGFNSTEMLRAIPIKMRQTLIYLGTISYSLYLVHYPFFKLAALWWLRRDGHPQGNFLVTLLFCILVVPVAGIFYHFCERPFHSLARRVGNVHERSYLDSGTGTKYMPSKVEAEGVRVL